jgi:A/G-specific adenine glycosylase
LLAEIFLRKTQAKQVAPIYKTFLKEFGTPRGLAEANVMRLRKIVWSLGLPTRVGELKKLGIILTTQFGGYVPRTERELMTLPGVGRYVARAVLAFAFGRRCSTVDANVIRLIGRYFGLTSIKSRAREDPELWRFCDALLPPRRASEFNWALFDFAALVCVPQKPRCQICPLTSGCEWFKTSKRQIEPDDP